MIPSRDLTIEASVSRRGGESVGVQAMRRPRCGLPPWPTWQLALACRARWSPPSSGTFRGPVRTPESGFFRRPLTSGTGWTTGPACSAAHAPSFSASMFRLHDGFHTDLVEALYAQAESAGYELVLSAVLPEAPERPENSAVDTLLDNRCEALLLIGPQMSEEQIEALSSRIPTVVLARPTGVDARATSCAPTTAPSFAWHSTISTGSAIAPSRTSTAATARGSVERRRAYEAQMQHLGLGDHVEVVTGGLTETAGMAATRRLLSRDHSPVGRHRLQRRRGHRQPGRAATSLGVEVPSQGQRHRVRRRADVGHAAHQPHHRWTRRARDREGAVARRRRPPGWGRGTWSFHPCAPLIWPSAARPRSLDSRATDVVRQPAARSTPAAIRGSLVPPGTRRAEHESRRRPGGPRAVRFRSRGLALLVAGTLFMEILDATVIAPAAPHIGDDFGVPAVSLNIAISAYVLTLAVMIPLSGWLADRFGARRVFALAVGIFTLASLGCAFATDLRMLTVMRVLQGLGGAMMVPVGRLVVLRMTAKTELVRAIAYLTWPALLAPVVAPAVGGLLSTYASWRLIFLINVPLGLVGHRARPTVDARRARVRHHRTRLAGFCAHRRRGGRTRRRTRRNRHGARRCTTRWPAS